MRLTQYDKSAIIRAIRDDIPKVDQELMRKTITAEIDKLLLPAVKKLAKEHPEALRRMDLGWYDMGCDRSWPDVMVGNVTLDQVKAICKPFRDASDKRRDVLRQLEFTMKGISTLAQAKKLLPEFISYFPSETEPTKNLPAVTNLMADLSKLGWPKQHTKKATT